MNVWHILDKKVTFQMKKRDFFSEKKRNLWCSKDTFSQKGMFNWKEAFYSEKRRILGEKGQLTVKKKHF